MRHVSLRWVSAEASCSPIRRFCLRSGIWVSDETFKSESSRKYFYQRPIGDSSETDMPHRKPIEDRHAWSETHLRLTCLIGDPFGDRHVSSEVDMPDRRHIDDRHAWSETLRRPTLGKICISHGSQMRHVSLRWVSAEACRSPIRRVDLRTDIWVSDETFRSQMGLRWDSDRSPILIMFSWTKKKEPFFSRNFLEL